MATSFQVDVVTPEAVVWSGEAEFVSARTVEGDIGVLADHEPTMAALGTGTAVVHHGAQRTTIALHGGFLQIYRNQVTLLSDRAEVHEGAAEDALELARRLREREEAATQDEEASAEAPA